MKQKIKVALVGCGDMGRTVAHCIFDPASVEVMRNNGDVVRLTVCDKSEAKLARLPQGCAVTLSAAQAVSDCDYVILAVEPDELPALSAVDFSGKVVISVIAGLSLDCLSSTLRATGLARATFNLNSRVGEGFIAYAVRGITEREHEIVRELLGCLGMFRELPEPLLDGVAGVSCCGAACVYTVIKALIDEATARGLDPDTAKQVAVQTVLGSALCCEREADLDALISLACAEFLSHKDLYGLVRGGLSAALSRGEETRK